MSCLWVVCDKLLLYWLWGNTASGLTQICRSPTIAGMEQCIAAQLFPAANLSTDILSKRNIRGYKGTEGSEAAQPV